MQSHSNLLHITARLCAVLVGFALFAGAASAQTGQTGMIQGRIQNIDQHRYLNNARVTVQGTTLETFTDNFGQYRLGDVPVGQASVTVYYSGLSPQTAPVTVTPGATAVKDFDLSLLPAPGETVVLEKMVVSSTREMSGAAIATNEQRFAPNMKIVLAAETFGSTPDNNVAEFLKLMPGIDVGYADADATSAALRGFSSNQTIVNMNGNKLASANSASTDRTFKFDELSINNISRIEFNKTATADMPADGLGGTINLITKSAFERSKPELQVGAYIDFNTELFQLGLTPGPGRSKQHKWKPGADFSYVNPVTKNWGYNVSASLADKFYPVYTADRSYQRTGTGVLDPVTHVETPYLNSLVVTDAPKHVNTTSFALGLDFRPARNDTVKVTFDWGFRDFLESRRRIEFSLGTATAFSPTFSQGANKAANNKETFNLRQQKNTTWTPMISWRHDGPIWKSTAGFSYSHSSAHTDDLKNGYFAQVDEENRIPDTSLPIVPASGEVPATGSFLNPTLRFDAIPEHGAPHLITETFNGVPADPFKQINFMLRMARGEKRDAADIVKNYRYDIQRDFFGLPFPLSVKTGVYWIQHINDINRHGTRLQFLGPDGIANTEDNRLGNYDIMDVPMSDHQPPGGLQKVEWIDPYKIRDMYIQHPEWFINQSLTSVLVSDASNSPYTRETTKSAYVRLDSRFFQNRLSINGGWRYQQTSKASNTFTDDATSAYLKDENGHLVLDDNNQPIKVALSGYALAQQTLKPRNVWTFIDRPGHIYPSFNAKYNLTENTTLAFAWSKSINEQNLTATTQGIKVSDPLSTNLTVTVNPLALEPTTATHYELEYDVWTKGGGSITLSWYRNEVNNFINNIIVFPQDPEHDAILEKYGLDPQFFSGYKVTTQYNGGTAISEGIEFTLDQPLDQYLPVWGRGIEVWYNLSYRGRARGVSAGNLNSATTRRMNWGITFQRNKFSGHLKWHFVPEDKRVVYNTSHNNSQTTLDADLSYYITPQLRISATAKNIWNVHTQGYFMNTFGTTPDYSRLQGDSWNGTQVTLGLRATF